MFFWRDLALTQLANLHHFSNSRNNFRFNTIWQRRSVAALISCRGLAGCYVTVMPLVMCMDWLHSWYNHVAHLRYILKTFNNHFPQMLCNCTMWALLLECWWRYQIWITIRKERCYAHHFKNISICLMDLWFMLWYPKVNAVLIGLYMKTVSVICFWSCVTSSIAEIMLHGYMATPVTTSKLRMPCLSFPFAVAANRKHGEETCSKFKNNCHVKTHLNWLKIQQTFPLIS
jgi:hypothetical protein